MDDGVRRTLAEGAGGDDVRMLQSWLQELGVGARVPVDGVYGPETVEAVRAFQSRRGLPADGIVGPATWGEVELSPSVRGAMARLPGEVTAAAFAAEIVGHHGEYGDGRGRSLALDRESGARHTPAEWLRLVRAVLDPVAAPRLHGRVVIAGLARVDEDLRRQLAAAGFLTALEAEIDPPLRPLPVAPSTGMLAGYVTDAVPAGQRLEDRLGVEDEANALAGVLIARDVRPPLSIGLFGDWGTGKSFFMGLMQQRIEALTKETRDRPDEQSAYCGHVRQITFNAWHYADANLWASLVTRVFEGLAESGEDRSKLIGALETNQRQRNLAEAQVAAARADREQAEQALIEVQRRRDAASHQASSRRTVAQVAADPAVRKATEQIGDVLSQDATQATKEIIQTAGALQRLWTRKRILWRELRHRYGALLYVGLAAGAVVLAGLLTLSLTRRDWLVTGLAYLATAGAALRGPAKKVREAERIVDGSLDVAQARIKAEEDAAAQAHATAAAAEQQAHAQLQEIDSGRQLLTFIAQRSAASEYQAKLGLIAAVREDFERLTALLAEPSKGDLPLIERVVLYIDDLDRCPADRVVEVLEAVHLLLAFELFVVVVGVDSRWLLNSLRRHYASQLADGSGDGEDAAHWASTPQNYLEKIFQIPFALRGMDDDGFGRLVADLLRTPGDGAAPDGNPPAPPDRAGEPAAAEPVAAAEDGGPVAAEASGPATAPPIELRPRALRFTAAEIDYLAGLRTLVATPRAAKRLANTYRLVRAGLGATALERFTGEDGGAGQYREVLLLLTSLAHSSSVGGRLLEEIAAQPPDGTWAGLIARLGEADDDPGWTRFVGCLEAVARDDEVKPSIAELKSWAPKVARFSFVAGMPRVS